ncbi:hypothetical protein Tco_1094671 [Tanacetum coccineum]|uniref:Reverse transcriptase domain-containing protein n=1 Tax=Tanacetum coccineum TaxID=301880 RepID=A0ABQ5IG60_9ASTR
MAGTLELWLNCSKPPTRVRGRNIILICVANNFELKHGLINLVQNKQFFGHDKEDPHAHIRYFNKITSTMRVPNVPIATIKLMLFPFSIEGAARIWLEKEPPRSIQTWDDLARFDESFYEAWDRFNDLLRACPHHGFSELHQLDTFYNALNINDQDSLNSAAVVAKVSTNSSTQAVSSDVAELKDIVRALLLDKKNQASAPAPAPAPVKAVELRPPLPSKSRNFSQKFRTELKGICLPISSMLSLEGDNKLTVIIAKELDVRGKIRSHKVLSPTSELSLGNFCHSGYQPDFCTTRILMEEDYAPAVQHQRRVNHKIQMLLKRVEKLLEAGLIYPISDSPWVSPITLCTYGGRNDCGSERGKMS